MTAVRAQETHWPGPPGMRRRVRQHPVTLETLLLPPLRRLLLDLVAATEEGASEGALTPTLNALGAFYDKTDRLAEAEAALLRSLDIESRVSGEDHLYVTESLVPLAELAQRMNRVGLARERCERAVGIAGAQPEATDEVESIQSRCAPILGL